MTGAGDTQHVTCDSDVYISFEGGGVCCIGAILYTKPYAGLFSIVLTIVFHYTKMTKVIIFTLSGSSYWVNLLGRVPELPFSS